MMQLGINYLVSHAYCKNCNHTWTAIVEVKYIELIGKKEYNIPEFLECPGCKSMFSDFHGIITNEELKNKYFKK